MSRLYTLIVILGTRAYGSVAALRGTTILSAYVSGMMSMLFDLVES